MRGAQPLQVTHVWYQAAPHLNFGQIITDLGGAVTAVQGSNPTVNWDSSTVARLATFDALVIVGCQQNLSGAYTACLTIAIGQSPIAGAGTLDPAHQTALSQAIFDTLQDQYPADRQQFFECRDAFDVGLIDRLMDAAARQTCAQPPVTDGPGDASTKDARLLEPISSFEMGQIMQRLSADLTAGPSGLISRAIAAATAMPQKLPVVGHRNSTSGAGLLFRKSGSPSNGGAALRTTEPSVFAAKSSSELLAVRRALYGVDPSRGGGLGQIGTKTKQMLQQLAGLRHGLANRPGQTPKEEMPKRGDELD